MRSPELVSVSPRGDAPYAPFANFTSTSTRDPTSTAAFIKPRTTRAPPLSPPPPRTVGSNPGPSRRMARKEEALLRVFASVAFHQAVVFARRAAWGESLTRRLREVGYPALHLAGHLPQPRRMEVMRRVRAFEARVLVATDVAARGLDLERVNLVAPRRALGRVHVRAQGGTNGEVRHRGGIGHDRHRAGTRGVTRDARGGEGGGGGRKRLGPTRSPPPPPRLEPLPETVPADWYDYELDEVDVANAERLRSGAFVGEEEEKKASSRRSTAGRAGGDEGGKGFSGRNVVAVRLRGGGGGDG